MTTLRLPVAETLGLRRRRATDFASALTAVGTVLVLCAAAVALHVKNGSTELTSWCFGNVVLALVLLMPGALLLAGKRDNPIGWLICASCVAQAACAAGRDYFVFGARGATAPGWLWIGWLGDAGWLVSVTLLPVIIVLFPGLRPLSARRVVAPVVVSAAVEIAGYLLDEPQTAHLGGRNFGLPPRAWLPLAVQNALGGIVQLLLAASVLYAVVVFTVRYRRTRGEERAQYRWLMWAGSIGLIELVTEFLPINPYAVITGPATQTLIAAAITVAILRHRLFDIDVVLNRTLLFAVLSALVALLYVATVAISDLVLRDRPEIGPGLIATGLVAVVLTPARTWVQQRVDRLVYGQRRDPYRALSALGSRLADDDRESQLDVVVHTVREALKLTFVAIRATDGTTLAETGRASRMPIERPLTYRSAIVGTLLVQNDASTSFGRSELRLLDDLARQAGAAVYTTRLTDDLRASRTRLVATKEEERRRLRRDLHDGLGPQLAAVGLKLDAATSLMDARPTQARDLVDSVRDDIRTTIADVRVLVYGLRPPALDELGLVGAVRECVQRFDHAGARARFTVTAGELPVLPAAVEVAAYWIVNEAVTNVVRHSGARSGELTLALDDGHLIVRICDDGCGLPTGWRPGVGTSSMSERANEVDGVLHIGPHETHNGTVVSATLPLQPQFGTR